MISEKIRTAQGMEGARRATGIPCAATAAQGAHSMPSLPAHPPDPEVPEKAARRRFTAEYKLNILRQADHSRTAGEVGALLRREGFTRPISRPGADKGMPGYFLPPKAQAAGPQGVSPCVAARGGSAVQREPKTAKASPKGRVDHRHSKKNFTDAGDPPEEPRDRRDD